MSKIYLKIVSIELTNLIGSLCKEIKKDSFKHQ